MSNQMQAVVALAFLKSLYSIKALLQPPNIRKLHLTLVSKYVECQHLRGNFFPFMIPLTLDTLRPPVRTIGLSPEELHYRNGLTKKQSLMHLVNYVPFNF